MNGPQAVVVTLANLAPGITYHYRLLATGPGGTVYGTDHTFTTGEYPPSVVQEPPVFGTFTLPSEQAPKVTVKKVKSKKPKKATARKSKARGRGAHRSR